MVIRLKFQLVGIFSVIFAMSCLIAQEETGNIAGCVLDPDNIGVPMCLVQIFEVMSSTIVTEVFTDPEGHFSTIQIPCGHYTVYVNPTGDLMGEWFEDYPYFAYPHNRTVVFVYSHQTTDITSVLAHGGNIYGKIVNTSGNPIEKTVVVCIPTTYSTFSNITAVSNQQGEYLIPGLPPGEYKLLFETTETANYSREYYSDSLTLEQATPISVTLGEHIILETVVLNPAATVEGYVSNDAGVGISEVIVYISGLTGITDSAGHYLIQGIPAGMHKVYYDASLAGNYISEYFPGVIDYNSAQTIETSSGQVLTGIDISLNKGGLVSGRLIDQHGIGVSGISVWAYKGRPVRNSYTDDNGIFLLSGLPEGEVTIQFVQNDVFELSISETITEGEEIQIGDVFIETPCRSCSVSGYTLDEANNGILGVKVTIDSDSTIPASVYTDCFGFYRFGNLKAGSYLVSFDNHLTDNFYAFQTWSTALIIQEEEQYEQINAIFRKGAIVEGKVFNYEGEGIFNVGVNVYDRLSGQYLGYSRTNSLGEYKIIGIRPGVYDIFATYKSHTIWNNNLEFIAGQVLSGINFLFDQRGVVRGRIVKSDGNFISGANLNFICDPYTYCVSSNYEGFFFISLPVGAYKINISANDSISEYYDNKLSFEDADKLSITTDCNIDLGTITLSEAGKISGFFVFEGQSYPELVLVKLFDEGNQISKTKFINVGYDSSFSIDGLEQGNYKVLFDPFSDHLPVFYPDSYSIENAGTISVYPGQNTNGIVMDFKLGSTISGYIYDENGDPVQYAATYAYDSGNLNYINSVASDQYGYYYLNKLPQGSYKIYFSPPWNSNLYGEFYNHKLDSETADIIIIPQNMQLQDINGTLSIFDAGAISGSVTDEGGVPISGIIAAAVDLSFSWSKPVFTDQNGNYSIESLPVGDYKVQFWSQGNFISEWYNNKSDYDEADVISVLKNQITSGINAQLKSGSQILGKVTDSENSGIGNVEVHLENLLDKTVRQTNTDRDGNYELQGLTSGSYKVWFHPLEAGNYLPEYFNNKGTFETADIITLDQSETLSGCDAILSTGGSISGTVRNQDGTPLVGVRVHAEQEPGLDVGKHGLTDENGHYQILSLPTADYRVVFWSIGTYIGQYYNGMSDYWTADVVHVIEGQDTPGIDAELVSGGSVSGQVTDPTGNALDNVDVFICDLSEQWVGGAWTDNLGYHHAPGVLPGPCKVFFGTSRWVSGNIASEWYNHKSDFDTADTVMVYLGQDTAGINTQLSPGGAISGRVTDISGAGIPGIEVRASSWDSMVYNTSSTNKDGYYLVDKLSSGDYRVYFEGYGPYVGEWYDNRPILSDTQDPVAVLAGQITDGIDAQLSAGGIIRGRVTDASGNGIQDVYPVAYDEHGNWAGNDLTDSSGSYEISGISPGSVAIKFNNNYAPDYAPEWYDNRTTFSEADLINIVSDQIISGVDAVLTSGGSISGFVSSTQKDAIGGVTVYLYALNHAYIAEVRTDSSGFFSFTQIFPGQYKIKFEAPFGYADTWYSSQPTFEQAEIITASDGTETSGINQVLNPGGGITGRITDLEGNPISQAFAYVYPGNLPGQDWLGADSTDADGQYQLIGLAPGQYQLEFVGSGNYLSEWYDDQPSRELAGLVEVSTGQSTGGINAQLSEWGAISGTILDSEGNPVEGAGVWVYDQEQHHMGWGTVQADGSYLARMMPGSYKVLYYALGFKEEWYENQDTFADADWVTVSEGQTTTDIDVRLDHAASISGRVLKSTIGNVPIAGVWVYPYLNGVPKIGAQTGADGYYTIYLAEAGDYKIVFSPPAFYLSEWYNGKKSIDTANVVHIDDGQAKVGINARLESGGMITGRVTDPWGQGIDGAWAYLYQDNKVIVAYPTGKNGVYSTWYLPRGTYQLQFGANRAGNYVWEWYPEPVVIQPMQITSGIDAQLEEDPSAYSFDCAHVASTQDWWTKLTLINPGETDEWVYLQAIDAAGLIMETYWLQSLPPGTRFHENVDDLFRKRSGNCLLCCDRECGRSSGRWCQAGSAPGCGGQQAAVRS